ncbi:MAG: universal stress protein [Flammeovirgaceae bacterium]|nr:MAG: universal stress protein [Flammeovirgaceae bacterium]
MDPVLCALDFSENSPVVLKAAVNLAAHFHTRLIVLYAYRIIPENETIADYRRTIVKKAQENFAQLEKKLGLNGSIPYEFRAEVGFLSDRIKSSVQANRVGFVVIGQRLASEIIEQKGMTLEGFIGQAPVPVLIVPEMQAQP